MTEQTKHMQIKPGKAEGFKKKHGDPWTSEQWSGEEKFDGHRGLLHFGRSLDRAYLTGREPTKESNGLLSEKAMNVPHIWTKAHSYVVEKEIGYTVFDGEILVEGTDIVGPGSSKVQSVMGASVEKALARFKEGVIATYVIFDILFWNGTDVRSMPLLDRRELAFHAASELGLVGSRSLIPSPENAQVAVEARHVVEPKRGVYSRMAKVYRTGPWFEGTNSLKDRYDRIVAADGEVMILKRDGATYGEDWVKVKKEFTVDVVIFGFTEAEAESVKVGSDVATPTKYAGMIGAVEFGVYDGGKLVRIGQASGMDDELRSAFSADPKSYLGRAVEVKANEFTGKALRHPRFLQFRDDIQPSSCTLEKLKRDTRWNQSKTDPE